MVGGAAGGAVLMPAANPVWLSGAGVIMVGAHIEETCCARVGASWGEPGYSWCARRATWRRGDQFLCEFHAGVVTAGTLPRGINACGHWEHSGEECA